MNEMDSLFMLKESNTYNILIIIKLFISSYSLLHIINIV